MEILLILWIYSFAVGCRILYTLAVQAEGVSQSC